MEREEMASSETQLENEVMEVGNNLLNPPSSIDELLPLLDQVGSCLSRVDQSPSKSMRTALCSSMKALVADELLRHSDIDVKVAVASCISEITRITAPDAPYDDEQMKEIFQLIVAAFEKLYDTSSCSYTKRVSILETVANVQSCLVMLDLECDSLILEMFQHFFKAIRDNHPDNVFSSMETIMTLVLEEGDDISLELLSPLLTSVKKKNQDVLPIARKLGQKVIQNCAAKLKPCIMQAVQSMCISFNDYSKVVASICQGTSDTVEHNDVNTAGEMADEGRLLENTGLDEPPQVAEDLQPEAADPGSVDPSVDKSPKSVIGNGTAQIGHDDSLVDPSSLKRNLQHSRRTNQSKNTDAMIKTELDSLDSKKVVKSETEPDQAMKKTRGGRRNSLMNSTQDSGHSRNDHENETVELPDHRKSHSKEIGSATSGGPSTKDAAVPSEHEKETQTQLSSPIASLNEAVNIVSPSPTQTHPDGTRSRKGQRWPKKKGSINQEVDPGFPTVPKGALLSDQVEDEAPPSAAVISKKESEVSSDSEAKSHMHALKKTRDGIVKEETPTPVDVVSKKESVATSDSEVKPLRKSGKKVDARNANEDESSLKQQEDKRKRGRGKTVSDKDVVEVSSDKKMVSSHRLVTKSSNEDQTQLEETPRTSSKRKHAPVEEETSEMPHGIRDFGENLVGSKIKVWWPEDLRFYEGQIESFDPVEKKHKVIYIDGDIEILTLGMERWEFVKGDNVADGGQAPDLLTPDASSGMRRKKAKENSDSSPRQAKADSSLKRDGGALSSKSKSEVTKSGDKSKDDGKLSSKSKEDTPKTVNRSKDDDTPKTGTKSKEDAQKLARKSKNDTSKISTKSNNDTTLAKSGTKSKVETPKTGSKSSAIGTTTKWKSSSSKVQEKEDSTKGKLSDSGKAQESETKSGKKRRRKEHPAQINEMARPGKKEMYRGETEEEENGKL